MTPRRRSGQQWTLRAVGLVPAFVVATFVADGSVPVAIRLEAVVVLVATMVRPAIGLMLVALLAPLGDAVVPLLGAHPVRHAETVVVAFLAGWLSVLASEDEPRPPLPTNLANAMWVFSGVLIASVAGTALQLQKENLADLNGTLAALTRAYLVTDDPIGMHTAGQLLEGLGLMGAAAQLTRRDPRDGFWLLLSLVASGVVASVASALLTIGVGPVGTLARHVATGLPRYSATTGDVNATASWYMLLVGVSGGVAISIRSTRVAWLVATVIMLAGLVLTGSGAGMIAGAVVLSAAAMMWIAFAASRRRKIVGTLILVPLVVGAIAFARTARAANSLDMRAGFTQASMRFIEARPLFGIGAGRYYPLSKLALPPRLSWVYAREHAHDYYLQLAAELGLVGAVAFGWVIGAALGAPLKRVWRGRADGLTAGYVGGVIAYLVTALTGHPFLVPEAAMPFWIVLGLLAAQQAAPAAAGSRWRSRAAIAFACALVLTAPLRDGVAQVRLPPGDDGFGPWQTDESGRPFREVGALASLFVGPTITGLEIPMRLGRDGHAGSAIVAVWAPGAFGGELRVGRDWSTLLVTLPGAEVLMPRQRINLAVTLVEGGAPARGKPGVDVGQIRLVSAK